MMPKIGEGIKSGVIKDSVVGIIKFSESVALQAVDSATVVLKAGLDNAEALSARANDLVLNTIRRGIGAGSTIGDDVREIVKSKIKGTIQAASEISGTLKKEFVHTAVTSKTTEGA